jgi:hypothetical protein
MASGHEYRTRRPNTWLLRPTPQVKILLANPEPSTHGPSLPLAGCRCMSVHRSRPEVCSRGASSAASDPKRTISTPAFGPHLRCSLVRFSYQWMLK